MPTIRLCVALFLLLNSAVEAQTTLEALNYLSVARNSLGEVITNQEIQLQLQLFIDDSQGELLYTEIQKVTTTSAGVFSIIIGEGIQSKGTFSEVPWDKSIIWIEVRLDEQQENEYLVVNSSQILSLPPDLRPIRDETPFDRVNCQSGMAFWGISGNSNLKNECHYLGTKNEVDVIFKTNSTERLRIKASGKTIFTDSVLINSQLSTRSINLSTGARQNFLMVSDDQGNARWAAGKTIVDADTTNELQQLSRAGEFVFLSKNGGSFEDKTIDADANPKNEIQLLSRESNRIYLSKEGGSFIDETADADADPSNELQILTKTGNKLSLSGNGGTFSIDDADADPLNEIQQLSLNYQTNELSLSRGNSVNFGSLLSNHWNLNGTDLSSGNLINVGIGTPSPSQKLQVNGGIALGNTSQGTAGTIRWNGTDFQGFNGTAWKSLTLTSAAGTAGNWTKTGSSIHYSEGAVGIGINEPKAQLDVSGSQRISDNLGIGMIPDRPFMIGSPEIPEETPTLINQQNDVSEFGYSPQMNTKGWQSFRPSENGILTMIMVNGSACGGFAPAINRCTGINCTIDLYEGEGTTGRLITGGIRKNLNTGTSSGDMAIALPGNIQVKADQQYTLQFTFNDEGGYNPTFNLSGEDPYPRGRAVFENFKSKEGEQSNLDMSFKIFLKVNRPGEDAHYNFVVNDNGQVGIGIGQPRSTLDVDGVIMASGLETTNLTVKQGATEGFLMVSDDTGVASWRSPKSVDFRKAGEWQVGNDNVYLAGTERVGIGINQPRYSIDIAQQAGSTDPAMIRLSSLGDDGGLLFEKAIGSQPNNYPRAKISFDGNKLSLSGNVNQPAVQIDRNNNLLLKGSLYTEGSARFVTPGSEREPGDGYVRIIAPKTEGQTQALYVGVKQTANFMAMDMDGQVWVNGIPSETAYDNTKAYPFMVSGGQHGIGVQVGNDDKSYGGDNNFMTFFSGSRVAGRIEGFNADSDWDPPIFDLADPIPFICYLQEMLGGVPPPDGPSIGLLPASVALNILCKHAGVSYASGNGDYAEYLEKENPQEQFTFGDIVGVRGGKISKNTEGAEQIMCVSLAPIVLGKQPPHDSLHYRYEKIGFMGQVFVKVAGPVNSGDYIVASGKNNGFGYAVAPQQLEIEHLSHIVGRSFTTSSHKGQTFVNVVIGVKTNEWIEIFKNQQQRLEGVEKQVDELISLREENKQLRADLNQVMTVLGLTSEQPIKGGIDK